MKQRFSFSFRISVAYFLALLVMSPLLAQAQQIGPNPNPNGNWIGVSGWNASTTGTNILNFDNYGVVQVYNSGTLTNEAGGTINNFSGASLGAYDGGHLINSAGASINNSVGGGMNVGPASSFQNDGTFTNHGDVATRVGAIANGDSGKLDNFGQMSIDSDSWLYNAGSMNNAVGATVDITRGAQLNNSSGTLQNRGAISIDMSSSLHNSFGATLTTSGTISGLGSIVNDGVLSVVGGSIALGSCSPGSCGSFTSHAGSTIGFDLASTVQGTGYGWVNASSVTLDGTLSVNLVDSADGVFAPNIGDTFTLFEAVTISGNFSSLSLAPLPNGETWAENIVSFGNGLSGLQLNVVAVPEPQIACFILAGMVFVYGFVRRARVAH